MKFSFLTIEKWPKTAWVSIIDPLKDSITALCGPFVEKSGNWAVEAVWNGDFEKGGFHETDLVFGTGIKVLEDSIIFVSSASANERLWYSSHNGKIFVSNTLPGLLKTSGIRLNENYKSYQPDLATIERIGISNYKKKIPSKGPDLSLVYYNNLIFKNGRIEEIEKPFIKNDFKDYNSYKSYLFNNAEKLGINARSKMRKNKVEVITGISLGYDSVAASVLAKHAGCSISYSITKSSCILKQSDSGENIAKSLGLKCLLYENKQTNYKNEAAFWAGMGHGGGRNISLFDYPKSLSLFFTGVYGDTIWDYTPEKFKEHKGDTDMLYCEFRLHKGVFFTPVPWWGIRESEKIQKISRLPEMKNWSLGGNYDRPIPRRIGEEAGIPRNSFGMAKRDTASNTTLWWPSTKEARKSLKKYLLSIGVKPLSDTRASYLKFFFKLIQLIYLNTAKKMQIKKWWRPWEKAPGRNILFVWANHTLMDYYPLEEKDLPDNEKVS